MLCSPKFSRTRKPSAVLRNLARTDSASKALCRYSDAVVLPRLSRGNQHSFTSEDFLVLLNQLEQPTGASVRHISAGFPGLDRLAGHPTQSCKRPLRQLQFLSDALDRFCVVLKGRLHHQNGRPELRLTLLVGLDFAEALHD